VPSADRSIRKLLPRPGVRREGRPPDARLVLEALLSSVPIPLTVWNEKAVVSHANEAARELLGPVATPCATADHWMRTLEPRTLSGLRLPLEDLPVMRALQGESPSLVDLCVRAGEESLQLQTSAKPILDQRGRPRGALFWSPTAKRRPGGDGSS